MEKRKIDTDKNQNLLYGTRSILEAIEAGREIEKILLQRDVKNELTTALTHAAKLHNIPVVKVPEEKLVRVTKKNHQGAIAYVSPVMFASLDNIVTNAYQAGRDPFILILDRVTDVRNFGGIVRTAECCGVDAVLIPTKGSAQINADAVKTSAGALHHIPICREHNLKIMIQYLKDNGIRIVAATEKATQNLFQANLTGPIAVMMGSEEDGVSPAYLDLTDDQIAIPMFGKIASLNVSVSAAVILYECVRTRSKG